MLRITILVCCLIGLILSSCFFVYTYTKNSYYAVGFTDGAIMQKYSTIKIIKTMNTVSRCENLFEKNDLTEIVSVKSDAIYAFRTKDDSLKFCAY